MNENLFDIIYEDTDVLVIDKPAGLVVESEKKEDATLETILRDEYGIELPRSGIVHRLDRETSGLMVIAKSKEAQISLQNQFASHSVKKIYTALVYGKLTPEKGTINIALKRDPKNRTRFVASNAKDARDAITHYEVVGYKKFSIFNFQFSINDSIPNSQKGDEKNILSLLKINIETGRTHQIRAHLFAIGFPVIGDQVYKSRDSEVFSNEINLKRQFLHASELSFKHPVTGESMDFKSELPEDLQRILE